MRSLVILGAADGSLATYATARRMGLRTIAVDQRRDAPGVALADEHLEVSTREPDRILAALGDRTDLAGVMAPCSDIALPTQRELASRLGLPCGLTEAATRASVDKRYFRALCDSAAVPTYRWFTGSDPQKLVRWADELRSPVVVKPTDAQSARGITRCADPAEVVDAVTEALAFSYGGTVLIEEEVPGIHCGAECIVDDGRVVFLALTERLLTPPPLAITTGHLLPARLAPHTVDHVLRIVEALCERMGYRKGPLNLDLVVGHDDEPYLIEMGARTGGDPLGELVRRCYGVDPTRASIATAIGEPISLEPHAPTPVMVQVLSAVQSGRLVSVRGVREAVAIAELQDIVLFAEPGDIVQSQTSMASKIGYAVLAGPTVEGLRQAAERLVRTLRIEISSPADVTA